MRQLAQRREFIPSEPVYRNESSEVLTLQITPESAGRLRLSWPTTKSALVYVVQVFATDGMSVWNRETSATTIVIDSSLLPPQRPGVTFLAQIKALDAINQVVGRSELKPLPIH